MLTDEPFFGGALDDLRPARAASGLPVLRKDFIVDAYQVVEARAAGADAILLIVARCDDEMLARCSAAARALGMDALVEAHDAARSRARVAAGAEIIGINNRDLRTFKVDRELAARLRPSIPRRARSSSPSRASETPPTWRGCATPASTPSWSARR